MPITHCNCFCLPAKCTWPPSWNRFSVSKRQAALLKAFPSLQARKDSLLGSSTLQREDFNSGIPSATAKWRSNRESNSERLHPMSSEAPLSKYEMLIGRQTLKQRCLTDEEGCMMNQLSRNHLRLHLIPEAPHNSRFTCQREGKTLPQMTGQ